MLLRNMIRTTVSLTLFISFVAVADVNTPLDEQIAADAVSVDASSGEDFDSKVLLESANSAKVKNKVSFLGALRAYKKFKRNHREEVANFKARYLVLKKQLKDKNSELNASIRLLEETCSSSENDCNELRRKLIQSKFMTIMNPESYSWLDLFLPSAKADADNTFTCSMEDTSREKNSSFHAVIFGVQKFPSCSGADSVEIATLGPGLFFGFGHAAIGLCMLPGGGDNFGFIAGAAAIGGIEAGIFFGQSGICTLVGFEGGVGAYAGLSALNIE